MNSWRANSLQLIWYRMRSVICLLIATLFWTAGRFSSISYWCTWG